MRQTAGASLFKFRTIFFLFIFTSHFFSSARAIELDPYPVYDSFHDEFSISFFREEKPNCYWVNAGMPDAFFAGVSLVSPPPSHVTYALRGIEYGIRFSGWVTDQWRLTGTVPFEANAMLDSSGVTTIRGSERFGDMEIGMSFLLDGQRQKGNFIGLDGWFRFPTGTDPFTQSYPALSSGRGAASGALGVVAGQELWNEFSLFESFHYEQTLPMTIDAANTAGLAAGTFQWPDNIEALGRLEWRFFHRSQRVVSIFYQFSMRMSGLMLLNGQSVTYGQVYEDLGGGVYAPFGTTNQLFSSTAGVLMTIDNEFSAEVDVSDLPVPVWFLPAQYHPDEGLVLSLSTIFRPF
jgi:hypothetical protein